MPSRRVFVIAGAAIAGVAFLLLFSSSISSVLALGGVAGANTAATTVQSSSGTVYLTPRDSAAAIASAKGQPLSEMNIANNGLVLLRGARVTDISGTTLTVTMAWGGTDFIWKVHTLYNTKYFTAQGEKGSLADIRTGDVITVSGALSENGAQPAVEAVFVRE
ncbi:hypothetical protein A3C20_02385 [Candidatus Kaiserbacteria bacterium RIFCSPHIGHO2_02_FULL_55_25]|uniref:DUF5666 domain-containing protein n=1 Tax=Candidatus Kaiserbacteria bacterium RIFCSPHIGHO2_02_FULL_55_25 TaxID=1798498 RepID=A0A1F6E7Z6_9BACT|nr:MAG: hypothetical protein A2764_00870 [Candidatus Kaiserbacteria bacterium RIFCSPHIGHO2_01_FULL_55_79]OGG69834.1 MAG: hypothetical protein A3C20_02385 [Candidatus Kaiserbacteria bacterium RIFCSPHIGHO2_02_FULL_55_25]